MHDLVSDSSKNVVVLINDHNAEFGVAMHKLSARLNRPLNGVILVDEHVKKTGKNKPDKSGEFTEIVCDFSKVGSLCQAINPIRDNLLVVASSSERNQSYLKKALPHMPYIHGPTESSLDWSTHKIIMRKLLHGYNSNLVPRFVLIEEDYGEAIDSLIKGMSFPLIIKPNGLALSILVNKANNVQELVTHLMNSFRDINKIYARDVGRGKPSMVVEEFIEGDMYSIDSYVGQDGTIWSPPLIRAVPANSIGKEGFYGYQLDSALALSAKQIAVAQDTAKQAIHALGIRSSVTHIELFHTKKDWKIIELGARAGGYRQEMYELAYGIDHAYNELLIKIGLKPIINTKPIAYCSVINTYADKEGIITAIDGFENASNNPSVYALSLYNKVGDQALNSGSGGKYIVDGILHNKSLIKLQKDVDAVRSGIVIKTKVVS